MTYERQKSTTRQRVIQKSKHATNTRSCESNFYNSHFVVESRCASSTNDSGEPVTFDESLLSCMWALSSIILKLYKFCNVLYLCYDCQMSRNVVLFLINNFLFELIFTRIKHILYINRSMEG